MRTMLKTLIRSCVAVATVFLCANFTSGQSAKKFIELGWDIPDTAYLRKHHEAMQRETPFDGIMLDLVGTDPAGKRHGSQSVCTPEPWEAAWFDKAVEDLKACRWTTYTDNFIRFNFSPGNLDWDDDAGWKAMCGKAGICAKVVKEAGLKGIAVDFEPYGKAIFKYDVVAPPSDNAAETGPDFPTVRELVRRRGREWMQAIAAEYPDMVLMTLFIGEVNFSAARLEEPEEGLAATHYGLLPAFFNGMLDVVPPDMLIVDGCESGYYKNGTAEFDRHSLAVQSPGGLGIRLVAPENHRKYIAQVQVGFGFYLDMYTNPEGHIYYRGPKEGGTRLDRLAENLSAAKGAADEYVWIYGEQRRWWAPSDAKTEWEHWEQALPGMTETIAFLKNPLEAAEQRLVTKKATGTLESPLLNGDFSKKNEADSRPEGWEAWQHEALGTFTWDGEIGGGSARAAKVKWGCFLQSVEAEPGQWYYVSLDMKKQGRGQTSLGVRWQTSERRWTREVDDCVFQFRPLDPNDKDGWLQARGVVEVPEGVGILNIQAGIKGQTEDGDVIWFDNAVLVRVR